MTARVSKRWMRLGAGAAALLCVVAGGVALAAPPWADVGREAKPAEINAWNIDVRADLQGLPKGSGTVEQGGIIWDGRCASCHGTFAESNQVFTPIVGGTTAADIASGHVASLAKGDVPQRTTIMKLAHISTMWDYIHRAMPWNAPKSLSNDEVYAVTAYILNLASIVPDDFTLSDKNMADIEKRLPNRKGLEQIDDMWRTNGKGDTHNTACMKDCAAEVKVTSFLPDVARNAHGNLAEQNRLIGEVRGTDTSDAHGTAAAPVAVAAASAGPDPAVLAVLTANGCTACHSARARVVGPGFNEVAAKYQGKANLEAYLSGKIRNGGSGLWGQIPMPPQSQVSDGDIKTIVGWLAAGAK